MPIQETINWLLDGDVSIQYQTRRDILSVDDKALQKSIRSKGWGKSYLDKRNKNRHWGLSFYQPKWTSSHYTLLDLRNLCISRNVPEITETLQLIFTKEKGIDGGINPSGTINQSDVCINGMALNYGSYFGVDEELMHSVVDFILSQKMPDGGFNCRLNRSGARHSSMHTTLSSTEGIREYYLNGYTYRLDELLECEKTSQEFLLHHHLFKSDKTGEVIDQRFTRLTYPSRWRYDILRALDYFRHAGRPFDQRMQSALQILVSKRKIDGKWYLQAKHPGKQHFEMEIAGKPSRWNTLRALRVLRWFGIESI